MSQHKDQGQRTRGGQSSGFLLKKPVLWSVSAVLYVTGVAFLLLLNGQYFTNGVCALLSMVFSLAAWLRATETLQGRVFSMCMLLLYVVSITFIVAMLPSWYHEQKRFNQRGQLPIAFKRPVAVVMLRDRAGHARAVDRSIGCLGKMDGMPMLVPITYSLGTIL